MTRNDLELRARDLYARLHLISPTAAEEATDQVGLPKVFVWTNLNAETMRRLNAALSIRLLEASG